MNRSCIEDIRLCRYIIFKIALIEKGIIGYIEDSPF